jgi:hypothetical protein
MKPIKAVINILKSFFQRVAKIAKQITVKIKISIGNAKTGACGGKTTGNSTK